MSVTDADELLFTDEDDEAEHPSLGTAPWRVLVVDDEPEIHRVTKMVLSDFRYRGRSLDILSAYSGQEAADILETQGGIALILLDVVMETEDAGLRLIPLIREDMKNSAVRIILRTGQPGQAPEKQVIVEYDINDYKSKTELTAQKLFTAVVAALRSFEHISAIETNRLGLEKIIQASASLQEQRSLEVFAAGVLLQLSALLGLEADALLCAQKDHNTGPGGRTEPYILAGAGRYEKLMHRPVTPEHADPDVVDFVHEALKARKHVYHEDAFALYFRTPNQHEAIVYVRSTESLSEVNQQLLEVFCSNISVGFDNAYLFEQLKTAHLATVVALADLAEHKDNDTGEHVLRVAKNTDLIARELVRSGEHEGQIDDFFLEMVGTASILHDVGKVATPDNILRKPGPLDEEEWTVMERHAAVGAQILEKAGTMVDGANYLSLGAEIARHHHEKWDGSGYPEGLSGTEIPLSARIVAVADVFDALTNKRPYKDPWPLDKALDYIREASASHFDPTVVKAFLRIMARGEDARAS